MTFGSREKFWLPLVASILYFFIIGNYAMENWDLINESQLDPTVVLSLYGLGCPLQFYFTRFIFTRKPKWLFARRAS